MSAGINERIVKLINDKTTEDPLIKKFLIEMLLEEANHSSIWRYKEPYKKAIEKYFEEKEC